MWATFDDLYNHCTNDKMARWLDEYGVDMLDPENEDAPKMYGLMQAILLGHRNKIIAEWDDTFCAVFRSNLRMAESLLGVARNIEVYEVINNLMHLAHTENPDLRKEGAEVYASDLGWRIFGVSNNTLHKTILVSYEGCVLTGKDLVPENFQRQIEEIVTAAGAFCSMRVDWSQSHYNNGPYFDYSYKESIRVEIWSDCEEVTLRAVNALEGYVCK